jgi:hypothetical protein
MVKDASNNWALNSAPGGLDSFKAYQSTNSGDTYINSSNSSGHIRLNYETGSGAETDIYSGSSSGLVAAFLGSTAIKFPGLAAASGHNCLQIDNSGYISNSGSGCGSSLSGVVNTGNTGQVAYYTGNGNVIAGTNAVAVNAGGTGASTASQALQNLGAQPLLTGVTSDGSSGIAVTGSVAASIASAILRDKGGLVYDVRAYGATATGVVGNPAAGTDDGAAFRAALTAAQNAGGGTIHIPAGTYLLNTHDTAHTYGSGSVMYAVGSHLHFQCDKGAVLYSPTYQLFAIAYAGDTPTGNHTLNVQSQSPGYAINIVPNYGATSITTITASDASNFAAGDLVYLIGGPSTEAGGDEEFNWVVSADPGTGIIVLRNPTVKPYNYSGGAGFYYTGTAIDHRIVPAKNYVWYDESIDGCTAYISGGDFSQIGQAIGVKVTNNYVVVLPGATRGIFTGSSSSWDWEISHNVYENMYSNQPFMQPDFGMGDIRIADNVIRTIQPPINPSEGVSNMLISNNHIYMHVPSGASGVSGSWGALFVGTSYGLTIANNQIFVANDSSTAISAIALGSNNGACHHCTVSNNSIQATGNINNTINILGSDSTIASNVITTSGYGISVADRPGIDYPVLQITGNNIHLTSATGAVNGITIGTSKRQFTLASNSIWYDTVVGSGGYSAISLTGTGVAGGTISGNNVFSGRQFLTIQSGDVQSISGNNCTGLTITTYCVPTPCPGGQAAGGVDASGNAVGCFTAGGVGTVPPWVRNVGNGSDGSLTTASGVLYGIKYYTNFTVPNGNTVTISNQGLTIHASGTVTIAGKISGASVANGVAACGGSGGGSGGGAAAGTVGTTTQGLPFGTNGTQGIYSIGGGTAGASSGGNGGNGSTVGTGATLRFCQASMAATDGIGFGGGKGLQGGSSGGAGGNGGGCLVIIAPNITGTDGTHTGVIDLSGGYGSPASANSTGAGSGGGGGCLILSSQNAIPTMPTVWQGGGLGGLVSVPYAAAVDGGGTGGYCTLTVSGGQVTAAAVGAGGSGYVTAPTMTVLGGGGSSATVTSTISGGAINSCAVTANGSGYTAATYTTAGAGGNGGAGWNATYTGW